MQLTVLQRIFVVENYFRSYTVGRNNGASLAKVKSNYCLAFHTTTAPTNQTILDIVKQFRQTGCVNKKHKNKVRQHTVTNEDNIMRVVDVAVTSPSTSIRRISKSLEISR